MAWIKTIKEEEAEGALRALYERYLKGTGAKAVANILKISSLDPAALEAHLVLYRAVMSSRGELTPAEREALAVAVSSQNSCHY